MQSKNNQKIIDGICTGHTQTLTAFYRRNLPCIRKLVLNNQGQETDVEDLFQDSMLQLYQQLNTKTTHITCSIHSYFYAICRNNWRYTCRKKKRSTQVPLHTEIPEAPAVVHTIAQQEEKNLYQTHFSKLNASHQRILQLFLLGNSASEIAQQTGYSENYVRKKKFEAKKNLLSSIEKDPVYQELKLHHT